MSSARPVSSKRRRIIGITMTSARGEGLDGFAGPGKRVSCNANARGGRRWSAPTGRRALAQIEHGFASGRNRSGRPVAQRRPLSSPVAKDFALRSRAFGPRHACSRIVPQIAGLFRSRKCPPAVVDVHGAGVVAFAFQESAAPPKVPADRRRRSDLRPSERRD